MPRSLKPLILVAAILAIGAALGTTAQPAQARSLSICSKALMHDWLVDGRVDKTYPVHCYREALKTIPEDQMVYGTLRDDLNRALQNTIRQHNGHVDNDTPVPGSLGGGGGGGGGGGDPGGTGAAAACSTGSRTRSDRTPQTRSRFRCSSSAASPCADGGRRNQLFRSPGAGPAGGGRSATRRTLLLDAAEARSRLEKRPRGYT